jgi:hypothetical protein
VLGGLRTDLVREATRWPYSRIAREGAKARRGDTLADSLNGLVRSLCRLT